MIGDIFSMFLALAGTVCVIILTYYASKWYAGKMGPMAGGRHIKVVDRLGVSKSGSILIIEVQGNQYMVGVSEQNVQIMKKLDENIPFSVEMRETNVDYKGFVTNLLNRWRGVK